MYVTGAQRRMAGGAWGAGARVFPGRGCGFPGDSGFLLFHHVWQLLPLVKCQQYSRFPFKLVHVLI